MTQFTHQRPASEQQRADRQNSGRNNLNHGFSLSCSRCPDLAFVRIDDEYVLCASCWNKCCSELTRRLRDDLDDSVPARDVTAAANRAPESGAAAVTTDIPDAGSCGFGELTENATALPVIASNENGSKSVSVAE